MRTQPPQTCSIVRLAPLAAALTLAVGANAENLQTDLVLALDQPQAQQTWQVQNCNDSGSSSLRDIINNHAQSGDIVDLSLLPTKCGIKASKITLTSGEIAIPQSGLILVGPDASSGSVAIYGSPTSRVFNHTGVGQLEIESLTISDGHYTSSGEARGGCIRSIGDVYLLESSVTGCTVTSTSQQSYGGGIDADSVLLVKSTVSGNEAFATSDHANGAGISCSHLWAKYSSISSNIAHDTPAAGSQGGGAFVIHAAYIESSTVDYNSAASVVASKSGTVNP